MKKYFLSLVAWAFLMMPVFSQNIGINTDASTPNSNAILDIKSGNKGLLIPRMDAAARNAIPNTKGLLVFDTVTNNFWYNTGTEWQSIATNSLATSLLAATGPWLLTGNAGTSDTANFLGTTDSVALNFRVNNQPSGRIDLRSQNTSWGYQTLVSNTSGTHNTASGYEALKFNNIGTGNTADGTEALFGCNTGSYNTGAGYDALRGVTFSNENTADGAFALASTRADNNTGVGSRSLYSNTLGTDNIAIGYQTLFTCLTGSQNTAIGTQALFSSIVDDQTAVGYQALYSNTTGVDNTADGYQALYTNTAGYNNTAIGFHALLLNTTGLNNTAMGSEAMYNNINGGQNIAIGIQSLFENTSGSDNLAFGTGSLRGNITGVSNVAMGSFSLNTNSSGSDNTALGYNAMLANVSGNNNTTIGYFANVSTDGLSNATAIGANAVVDASNKIRIGNGSVTVIEGQVPFTTPSDGRYKFNVREDVKGLDFILHLRPVTYQFDTKRFDASMNHQTNITGAPGNYAMQTAYDEATKIRRSGFIAQEVEQAANAVGYDFSGIIKPKTEQDHYSLSYDAFVVPLVRAVQEQQQLIESQNKQIADLQRQIDEIKKLLQK